MSEVMNRRGLTIKGLLELEPLEGARLVAGHSNVNQVISRVNIVGSPDVLNFVRPQEFMMTTGYPFRDHVEELVDLLSQLKRKNVAGIGIKVQRFIDEIPQSFIEKANELHFPVVEILPTAVFSDIVRVAMEEVFYQESEHLMTLYNRVQECTKQMAAGKDIRDVIYHLEELMGNPVVVYDFDRTIIAPLFEDVLEEFELRKAVQALEAKTGSGIRSIKIRDEPFSCISIPLTSETTLSHTAFIACIETNYELTEVDCLTIEKMSTMLNMELANIAARKQIEKRYMDQFLKDVLLGEVTSDVDMEIRTQSLDLDFERKWYQVFIMDGKDKGAMKEELSYMVSTLSKAIKGQLYGTILLGEFTFLLIDHTKKSLERSFGLIQKEVDRFISYKNMQESYTLCVGDHVNDIKNIQESYHKAVKVNTIRQQYTTDKKVIHYQDLHLYRLLYLIPEGTEVIQYTEEMLGVLEQASKKSVNYIETLEAYFQANRNIRVTAETLYTHYNTVVYRMEKISALLNVDIDDPEVSLELQVALKLRKMNQSQLKKVKSLAQRMYS
ncbi:PucR family transcriptional regulator [Halalkalibacter sp. APA_J-10(15)]|uniref:PucR family transcriptional regulator n=1 Tax=unclassified Halalkalibacter TaxID=2893063 RepID=UPI001FF5948E|nr:PucR family transcriptional regulator [Halalkalibacter sp. APA_J-10(15)]MCK0472864.1 PucR family transcriptional regulator [Halalkalibacter sp. APA_J-10(15)]